MNREDDPRTAVREDDYYRVQAAIDVENTGVAARGECVIFIESEEGEVLAVAFEPIEFEGLSTLTVVTGVPAHLGEPAEASARCEAFVAID